MDEEVPLLVVLDERLHPEMSFDERIKATMTLQQVHLETNCAERNENKKEEEGVGEKTYASMDLLRGHLSILAWNLMLAICKLRLSLSMAVGLELDLLGTRSGRVSTGEKEAGGTCAASNWLSTAFPPTLDPPLVAALVAAPYLEQPYLSADNCKVLEFIGNSTRQSTVFSPTVNATLVAALVAGPYLEQTYLCADNCKVLEIMHRMVNVKQDLVDGCCSQGPYDIY